MYSVHHNLEKLVERTLALSTIIDNVVIIILNFSERPLDHASFGVFWVKIDKSLLKWWHKRYYSEKARILFYISSKLAKDQYQGIQIALFLKGRIHIS